MQNKRQLGEHWHKALPVCMEFLDLVPEGCLNEETQFTLGMEL